MSKYEFVDLFLQTEKDVKNQIELVLKDSQQPPESEELRFDISHKAQEPF